MLLLDQGDDSSDPRDKNSLLMVLLAAVPKVIVEMCRRQMAHASIISLLSARDVVARHFWREGKPKNETFHRIPIPWDILDGSAVCGEEICRSCSEGSLHIGCLSPYLQLAILVFISGGAESEATQSPRAYRVSDMNKTPVWLANSLARHPIS